jgi:hypothetical protein
MRNGRRVLLPAVEVVDADLRELLTADILAAIHQHLETLPPEKRMRPPQPIAPREQPVNVRRAPEKPGAASHAPLASAIRALRKPTPEKAKAKTLPPPRRLLAGL